MCKFFSVQKGGPLKSAALFGRTVRTCLSPALIKLTHRNVYLKLISVRLLSNEHIP